MGNHYKFLMQVASVTFDLLLLLVLGSYLIVLFSFLVITTRVWLFPILYRKWFDAILKDFYTYPLIMLFLRALMI